jgi:hypothetical protein
MKVVKLRLDTVLSRQLGELSGMLGLTLEKFCELAVLQKVEEILDATKKIREKQVSQESNTTETSN